MDQKRIKTALLAYGMSGEVFHGPCLDAHNGFEIKKVFQRNPAKKSTHTYKVVNSLEEIFDDDDIDLVIVNSPNALHYPHARLALQAGKHVIVEKPFTVTTREADQLIDLARDKRLLLTVYQNRRWDGGFLTVQRILREKLLGRVVEFEIHYDRYRNYIEEGTWKEEASHGTGILYNLGSHLLDQVLLLFGMPSYVDARLGIQRTGGRVIDFYDIRLEYNGLNVIAKSSYLVKEPGPMYRINGTEGSFVKFGIDPQEQALKEKKIPGGADWGKEPEEFWGKLNTSGSGKDRVELIETIPGNYLAFYDSVYSSIKEGHPPAVRPEESRDVIKIIEACIESSAKRCAIRMSED
jgi:scyllo-inositol 2-dehydrogenase (NADP+)